ncbi:SMI1/KNR4 family protein [Mucilaginibacter sp. X5P1]|uniref:SMI1/KNR4 family protein n=1 Tax=Mucilaginibacter sp. X5P1 TaxID=2723088 RepID=UPI00161A9B06|nr:SMI1/KNR4 family protein [Mucilaginibacter sp. X5P1]MBB6138273.1 hypothetical protein [Mucilaginibacter sp. X5P1]
MKEYFYSYGGPVSEKEIEDFIGKNNLTLPSEYIEFIKEVNGGETKKVSFELAKFDLENKKLDYYIDIDVFFSLAALNTVWNYTKGELNDDNLFPIAEVKGGMLICCLQLVSKNAEIYFYETTSGKTKLTESLGDFLELLIGENEVDFKKYGINYPS